MYNFLLPDEFVTSIYEITPEKLQDLGIKGIITDLDNTLVEWDRADATEELVIWLRIMKESGIRVIIASNNKEARVKQFAEPLGIPYIHKARKPLRNAFYSAIVQLGLRPKEVVMVGDQLLTDVMGANRLGLHTVLVKPVAQSDGLVTKFNRFIERRVFNNLKRKGISTWEEKE
ncbi:YqeG family HAD IIIA-type phosphatase [Lysinibacillus xylanilyticus]|uniref:YqeG family HAD IIIA-type phosphatase n=1 Tax=Lysinibacillus xylanilyticus TaxID=582475 RepID=UPI0038180277